MFRLKGQTVDTMGDRRMSDDDGRELPPGETRNQIRTLAPVRDYVKDRAEAEDLTISQYIDEHVLPDPERSQEWAHEFTDEDIVYLKVLPEIDAQINELTGQRVLKGETIAFWMLLDALGRGETDEIEDMTRYVSELLWANISGDE